MRLKDLLEGPELRAWEQNEKDASKYSHDYLSFRTMKDLYTYMGGSYTVEEVNIYPYLNKRHHNCIGVVEDKNPETGEDCVRVVSHISFYDQAPTKLPSDVANPLQVEQAWTNKQLARHGIATFLYATLVRAGFTMVSDRIQYLGGQQLWKSMASKAGLRDYVVVVYNEVTGFVNDENGQPLAYNGKNIDDSIIWQPNTLGRQTVMLMWAK